MKYRDPELGWIDTNDSEAIRRKIKLANPMNEINSVFDNDRIKPADKDITE